MFSAPRGVARIRRRGRPAPPGTTPGDGHGRRTADLQPTSPAYWRDGLEHPVSRRVTGAGRQVQSTRRPRVSKGWSAGRRPVPPTGGRTARRTRATRRSTSLLVRVEQQAEAQSIAARRAVTPSVEWLGGWSTSWPWSSASREAVEAEARSRAAARFPMASARPRPASGRSSARSRGRRRRGHRRRRWPPSVPGRVRPHPRRRPTSRDPAKTVSPGDVERIRLVARTRRPGRRRAAGSPTCEHRREVLAVVETRRARRSRRVAMSASRQVDRCARGRGRRRRSPRRPCRRRSR